MPDKPTLGDLLAGVEGDPLGQELETIRLAVRGQETTVFLVGGVPRDLILGRPSRDIDLVVEERLAEIVERVVEVVGGEPRYHHPFMTATLETDRGFRVDLARLRRERYSAPAALPDVEPGSLQDDLARRDFTVNAMAVEFSEPSSPLIDPHGGARDLAAKRLRVLHAESFRDDPTRVLRGLRLASELGFAFDDWTQRLASSAATREALTRLSGYRLWRELRACFRSVGSAQGTIGDLGALGLLPAIHPRLSAILVPPEKLDFPGGEADPVSILGMWAADLGRRERWSLAERLALSREDRDSLGLRPHDRSRSRLTR